MQLLTLCSHTYFAPVRTIEIVQQNHIHKGVRSHTPMYYIHNRGGSCDPPPRSKALHRRPVIRSRSKEDRNG